MEGAEESGKSTSHMLGVSGASEDSMHKLELVKRCRSPIQNAVKREREETGELELNLGLSTNGRFRADPESNKIRRSSSDMLLTPDSAGNDSGHLARGVGHGGYAPLVRTCSLPTHGSCHEGRVSMEKLKSVDDDGVGGGLHADGTGTVDAEIAHDGSENCRSKQPLRASIESSGSSQIIIMESSHAGSKPAVSVANTEAANNAPPAFANTEAINNAPPALVANTEATNNAPPALVANTEATNNALPIEANPVFDMPFVSTKIFGPNHNKIDGFLYRYQKRDEVKIVCVCHGFFLSPEEFVKHGGGVDVAHPMKHIVVNPFPLY